MRFADFIKEQIISESIEDKGIFKACFMSGQPGSGKSFVLSKISSGSVSPKIVNTDTWTEFLKAYGDVKWEENKEKVKVLTKNQLLLYLNSLLPLWVEGTSVNPSATMRRDGILKSIGYDTSMIWVSTPLETALDRAAKRERPVSPQFIISTYERIQKLKSYYKSHFTHFVEIDNGDGELTDKVILDSFKKMESWFLRPIENPIGIDLVEKMRKDGHKYLLDTHGYSKQYLNKLLDSWYRN